MKTRGSHRIDDERGGLRPVPRRQSRVQHHDGAVHLPIDGHPVVGLRLRPEHAHAHAPQTAGSARRVRSGGVRGAPDLGGRARRHEGADVDRVEERREARRQGAAAALRVRVVRRVDGADFLVEPAQPPRSRRHLRARLHPRRRGARRGMARAGTDDAEAEHVPRLHRLRRVSRQEQVHLAGPARDSGRQRRRPARRRGRQHAPRSVQGRGRASAVRRRHEHHARRVRCR